MLYSMQSTSEIFNLSPSTLRNYCEAFAEFFSDHAKPPRGKHRNFTKEDLTVISLIRNIGDYEAAYLALKNGQRGQLPDEHFEVAVSTQPRDQIILLQVRIQQLEAQVEQLQSERDKRIRAEGQLELVQNMLRDAHEEIIRLRSQK